MTFYDGSRAIGVGTLGLGNQDAATFTTVSLSVGAHAITAVYGGDGNFSTSTSTAINQGVNQASSSTTVVSSANPSSPVRRSRSRIRSTRSHRAVGRQLGPSRSTTAQPRWARPRSMGPARRASQPRPSRSAHIRSRRPMAATPISRRAPRRFSSRWSRPLPAMSR